jgi:hypothetical protein
MNHFLMNRNRDEGSAAAHSKKGRSSPLLKTKIN